VQSEPPFTPTQLREIIPIGRGRENKKTPASGAHGAPSGRRWRAVSGQACKTNAASQDAGLVSVWHLVYHRPFLAGLLPQCITQRGILDTGDFVKFFSSFPASLRERPRRNSRFIFYGDGPLKLAGDRIYLKSQSLESGVADEELLPFPSNGNENRPPHSLYLHLR